MHKCGVKKIVLLTFVLVLLSTAMVAVFIKPVVSGGTIYIRADGSVDPHTAPIVNVGNVYYTLTDDINESIVVERDNIVVDGAGYTLHGTPTGTGISLSGRSNVTIKSTRIEAFRNGIWLDGSSNNTISGNHITNLFGVNIRLGGSCNYNNISGNNIENNNYGITLGFSSNNTISGNNITRNALNGIELSDSSGNTISGNNIKNNRNGIWLEGSSNNTISGNDITSFPGVGISLGGSCNYNNISGNNITENFNYGVWIGYSSGNTIARNNIANNYENGIELSDSSGNTISRNNITNNGQYAIWLSSSSSNGIYENNIKNNGHGILSGDDSGIWLAYSLNNTIFGNNITNNDYGIWLQDSSNNTMSKNHITQNTLDGIRLGYSSNNIISGNNITANALNGIRLYESSNNNTISGNNITENTNLGIWIRVSSNNTLRNNDASNNKYNFGVYGWLLSHYVQNIDDSNTVDGKPVYYWVNRRDVAVPLDAGYVALINCTGITIQNLKLANNWQGALLANTTNSTMTKNDVITNEWGIELDYSSNNNTISGNKVTHNYDGIWLYKSSNDNTISRNNITENNNHGIRLYESSRNSISGNNITANNWAGIYLEESSHNNILSGNTIENNYYGIWLNYSLSNSMYENNIEYNEQDGIRLEWSCNYNNISGNSITENNNRGISLYESLSNSISGNIITKNAKGILLLHSSNNTLRNNVMVNNTVNFGVWGDEFEEFVNNVGGSNTVDGKPVFYWIGTENAEIPLDAGCVILVNCRNIRVENLTLRDNLQGISLVYTRNTTISRNTISNNFWDGIELHNSSNNTITGNNITANNWAGIYLEESSHNTTISGNTIENNYYGIWLNYSSNNIIYHNNFMDNTEQVHSLNSTNIWDDGYPSGGNYWSDYMDIDQYSGPYQNETGSDGIWDHPYIIDETNQDNYPIVARAEDAEPPTITDITYTTRPPFNISARITDDVGLMNIGLDVLFDNRCFICIYPGPPIGETYGATWYADEYALTDGAVDVDPIYVSMDDDRSFIVVNCIFDEDGGGPKEAVEASASFDPTTLRLTGIYSGWWSIVNPLVIIPGTSTVTPYNCYFKQVGHTSIIHGEPLDYEFSPAGATYVVSGEPENYNLYLRRKSADLGKYHLNLWAIDTSGNIARYWFELTTAPTIADVVQSPIATEVDADEDVTVTAIDVTDNVAVDKVLLSYSTDNVTFTNVTMYLVSGTNNYTGQILGQTAGTYVTYKVYANDTSGNFHETTLYVYRVKEAVPPPYGPTASFIYEPPTPLVNQMVTFNASASSPGWNGTHEAPIVNYHWDFGDGNITTVSHPVIAHTYTAVGTYMVNLTVIDNDGLTGTTIEYILVNTLIRSVDDPIGDVSAGFVDIVNGSVLSSETHLTVIIKLKELPHQLYFDDAETPDNYLEYQWALYVDVDGDPSTGSASYKGSEVCISIMHFKSPGSPPNYGTIIDETQQDIWIHNSTTGHWHAEAHITAIEDFSTTSLIMFAPLQLIPWENSLESSNLLFVASYYHDGEDFAYSLVANNPPYQPQLSIAPDLAVEDDDDLTVTVIGPTPADPDGDAVTYTYRWLVDIGTGEFLDDEHAGRGDHTGNAVPATDTAIGDIWKVEVTPQDEYGAVGSSITATWQPVGPLDTTKPVADAGPDQTVNEDTLVTFDGSGSTDNIGIVNYSWTFSDMTPQTLTGVNPNHTFATPGTYLVTLNVTDAGGNWTTDTVVITVLDVTGPVAEVGVDQPVVEGIAVSFDAGSSSDNVGIVSYEWDFGDETSGTGIIVTHIYAEPGTYIITLTVKDAAGNSDTDSLIITVQKDTDGDGIPDITDTDDDNDGANDNEDAFPLDPTETVDTDGDGMGNNADADDDNDEVPDAQDVFPLDPLESLDTDGDGIGNNADIDDDNDGVLDADDAFPIDSSESTDTDADGVGNNADTDDDNDGIPDVWETDNGMDPLDVRDASLDPDNDGLINLQEYLENKDPKVYDAEVLREPRSVYIVAEVAVIAAVATAATALLAGLGGLGQAFNSAVSKLPIPDKLKEFLKLYGEEIFETVDKVKLEALEEAPFITKGELGALGISALIVTIVFGYVEANGLPRFLNLSVLLAVIPSTLLSACMVSIVGELSEALCARTCRVYRQFRLWIYGLGAFLISGLLLLFPFASPGITRYQSGEISNKTKGLIVLSKMLTLLTLTIPFTGLFMLGFKIIGDAGLLLTLMTVCYSLVPLKPLVGKAVFDYRKDLSLMALVSTGILFYSCTVNLLPHVTYLAVGVISMFLTAITLNQLRKAHPK